MFKTKWDKVLLQMKRKPDPEDLKILFADQLRKSKKLLVEDIAHFDRIDEVVFRISRWLRPRLASQTGFPDWLPRVFLKQRWLRSQSVPTA